MVGNVDPLCDQNGDTVYTSMILYIHPDRSQFLPRGVWVSNSLQ